MRASESETIASSAPRLCGHGEWGGRQKRQYVHDRTRTTRHGRTKRGANNLFLSVTIPSGKQRKLGFMVGVRAGGIMSRVHASTACIGVRPVGNTYEGMSHGVESMWDHT